MSQSKKMSRFEKKVLAELTGKAKSKAEGIEIAARVIFNHAIRDDDSLRGQVYALTAVTDQLAKLSLPRAIAFVKQLFDDTVDRSRCPREVNEAYIGQAYIRSALSDHRKGYEKELSEVLAKGPVPPEKPRERVYAFLIPRG
jgi:hypothetical protein